MTVLPFPKRRRIDPLKAVIWFVVIPGSGVLFWWGIWKLVQTVWS